MKLIVKHNVSADFRESQAVKGIAVPAEASTVFEPPYPPLWIKHAAPSPDGETWHIHLANSVQRVERGELIFNGWTGYGVQTPGKSWPCWVLRGRSFESASEKLTPEELTAVLVNSRLTAEQEAENAAAEQAKREYVEASEARVAEAREAARVREAEAEAAKKEADAKAEKRIREWAAANGSELLKARIEGGFDWQDLAGDEFVDAAVAPLAAAGFASAGSGEDEAAHHTEPSLEEIAALAAARKVLGLPCRLLRVKYDDETRTELEVSVETPDGYFHNRYFVLP